MLKRSIFIGVIALSSVAAFADSQAAVPEFCAVAIQGGQGQAFTLMIPVESIQAPYALTGENSSPNEIHWQSMQLGQGAPVLVPR
jgi:hypothetical protein